MREIKFRGKHMRMLPQNNKLDGTWVYGYLEDKNYIYSPELEGELLVKPETVGQYTGLKDKNGVEIYEGDIIEFLGHKGVIQYECGSFGIVFREGIDWEEIADNICPVTGCDNALYACENDNYISLWEIYWNFNCEDGSLDTVEVIGNIYENPELLKGGEQE